MLHHSLKKDAHKHHELGASVAHTYTRGFLPVLDACIARSCSPKDKLNERQVEARAMALDEYSDTLTPLPPVLSKGLIAVAVCGSVSLISTFSLIAYLTYRVVSWRLKGNTQPTNQVFILIYNLLLADIQQGLAFTLNISSLQRNGIFVGTRLCWTQGWFVSIGDLASSVFIFAVAVHTWFAIVKEQKVSNKTLYCIVAGLWTFVYLITLIGPLLHPHELYVRAEAWVSLYQIIIFFADKTQ